jgi:hypothetical protein
MSGAALNIGERSKKGDGNFGYEKSFRSFVPQFEKYGTQRKDFDQGGRAFHAVRDTFRFHG